MGHARACEVKGWVPYDALQLPPAVAEGTVTQAFRHPYGAEGYLAAAAGESVRTATHGGVLGALVLTLAALAARSCARGDCAPAAAKTAAAAPAAGANVPTALVQEKV